MGKTAEENTSPADCGAPDKRSIILFPPCHPRIVQNAAKLREILWHGAELDGGGQFIGERLARKARRAGLYILGNRRGFGIIERRGPKRLLMRFAATPTSTRLSGFPRLHARPEFAQVRRRLGRGRCGLDLLHQEIHQTAQLGFEKLHAGEKDLFFPEHLEIASFHGFFEVVFQVENEKQCFRMVLRQDAKNPLLELHGHFSVGSISPLRNQSLHFNQ
jgi:hypothetical protein